MGTQVDHAVVASGDTLSGIVDVRNAAMLAISVPTSIVSGNMFVQAAFNTTSANFHRLQNEAGSGDLLLAAGAGAKMFGVPLAAPVRFCRAQLSNAQTSPQTLTFITKW